jgi:glucose/arabinose dehydrogenase
MNIMKIAAGSPDHLRGSVAIRRLVMLIGASAILAAACSGGGGVELDQGGAGRPPVITAPTAAPSEPGPEVSIPTALAVALTPIISIEQPIAMATHPTSGKVFVATKLGIVAEVDLSTGAIADPAIDIGSGLAADFIEQGLLGMAFSPDGEFVYLNFTDKDYATVIAEYPSPNGVIDGDAGRAVLRVDQPEANHNGGHMAFGPDGLLYIAFGDGGGSGDEFGNGQNVDTLLGSIARIDPRVQGDGAYAVPDTNPFASSGGAPEIFIWGARNPWRFSFDRLSGDLWIADVGQDALEEINTLYATDGGGLGANLGWSDVEGSAPFNALGPPPDHTEPLYEYGRAEGCSVTGGYVYRGTNIPELFGNYIFGDYCTSELWGLASSQSQGVVERFDLGVGLSERGLVSFFEDEAAELYILGFDDTVYRLDPAG